MSSSSARLRLLGSPVLSNADGTALSGSAAEPRRIALLAMLALHPKRTATRAELTSVLWPGRDTKEATQLLNQALFAINKALGDDAIFASAREIRLGSRVSVDALDFQAALEEGRPGDAIDLYSGPLLDGFEVDDSPEFQRWMSNERARLAASRKELKLLASAPVEIQHDLAEPAPEVVREVAKPRAEAKRRKPKRPKTPAEVIPAVEEPAPEVPLVTQEAASEAPPEVPGVVEEPAPEPAPQTGVPTLDFIAQESLPEVTRASQPPRSLPAEPPATNDLVIERNVPPPDMPSAPSAPPPVTEVTAPSRVEFSPEFAGPPPHIEPHVERPADELPMVYEPPKPPPLRVADFAAVPAEPAAFSESVVLPPAPPPPPPIVSEPAPARPARPRRPMRLPSPKLVIGVLVVALIAGGAYVARGRIVDAGARARDIAGDAGARARDIAGDASARARAIASGIVDARDRPRAIAVLPIEYTGRDPAGPALAAGITEQLRRMLAHAELLVTPGDRFAYRTAPYNVRSVAETLGVMHVLQGAMQMDDTTYRFRFQLVNVDSGTTWEQDYAPKLGDIFVLQEDVAETVAKQILPGPRPRLRRETQNGAAYQLVLRANERAQVRSDSAARQALDLYRQAIALDSSYARAWAGLARMSVRTTAALPAAGRDRQLQLASQAAQRAVSINDSLAEAHVALGMARSALSDMGPAETELQRAFALNPTRATQDLLVDLYLFTGRPDQALALVEEAVQHDSLSPHARADVARVLENMNRCQDAMAHLDRVANATRTLPRAAQTRAVCHAQGGRSNDAIAAARAGVTARDSSSLSLLGYLLLRAGNNAEATRVRDAVNSRVRRGLASALDLALLDAGAKNFDAASRRVQEAVDARSFIMPPGVDYVLVTGPLVPELQRMRPPRPAR